MRKAVPEACLLLLLPQSYGPRFRGRSRSYLITLGLQLFLPQVWPQPGLLSPIWGWGAGGASSARRGQAEREGDKAWLASFLPRRPNLRRGGSHETQRPPAVLSGTLGAAPAARPGRRRCRPGRGRLRPSQGHRVPRDWAAHTPPLGGRRRAAGLLGQRDPGSSGSGRAGGPLWTWPL